MKRFPLRFLGPALALCVLFLSILSWLLVFRDPRALIGIENFYEPLYGKLMPWYFWLAERSGNLLPTLVFAALSVIAIGLYLASLRSDLSKKISIRFAILFQLLAFLAYPVLSTDIFSYIFSDRVFTQYGENIWQVTPDTYPEDKFFIFADWKDQTKVYGALNQIVYLPAAYLGNNDLVLTVVLYKLTTLIFVIAGIWVLEKLTQDLSEKQQSLFLRSIFWNPLVILEFAGNGHNDIIMLFFVLLGILFWKRERWLWAGVALAAAVQIKLIPVVIFGFFTWYLFQKRNWRAALEFDASFVGINALAFLYMSVNPFEFLQRVLYNTSVYWQSLPTLAERFFPGQDFPFSLLFVSICLVLLGLQWKNRWHPIFTSALALLVYLFFFTAAYWNWYVLWIVFLLPFVKQVWLKNIILTFSFTSLLAYPLLWLGQRYTLGKHDLETMWMVLTYLWLVGVPIVVGEVGWKRPKGAQKVLPKL